MEIAVELIMFAMGVAVICLIMSWLDARRRYREALAEVLEEMEKSIVPAKLEIHHDCFYLFHCETDAFLAQGKTAKELMDHVDLRFQGCTMSIQEGDAKQIKRLKKEIMKSEKKATKLNEVANASTGID